jgi:lipopolysaccharide biosynthesis glycosyltransferase
MNNDCVIVINAYPNFERNENSIESIRAAAKRWGADFIEINKLIEKGVNNSKKMFFTRYETLLKFTNYTRVLMIDNDTIVNSAAPNIFDELEDNELAGVLDGNPTRFPNNLVKETIVRAVINGFDYESLSGVFEFDAKKHFDNYINGGILIWNLQKVAPKISNFIDKVTSSQRIMEALEVNLSDQNLPNIFYSHILNRVKILDDRWNWTMPDIAGKNGWFHDHFHPETSELVRWWENSESPPDWTDHILKGKMHPYIYHFCGTPSSKELGKKYDRWC